MPRTMIDQLLPQYSAPDMPDCFSRQFEIFAALPRNPMGKLQKDALRDGPQSHCTSGAGDRPPKACASHTQ